MTAPKQKSQVDFGVLVGGYAYNIIVRSGTAAILLLMMAGDIWLGTRFVVSFAVANQGSLSGLPEWLVIFILDWLPWLLSGTISGIQYLVVHAQRKGLVMKTAGPSVKRLLRAAWIIAILDTLMDMAGFMAWWYDDPKVGHWLVHLPLNFVSLGFALVVGFACFFHEPLVSKWVPAQLADLKAAKAANKTIPGTWIFWIFLGALNVVYKVVTNVCRGGGVLGALVLDLFLSAFFLHQVTQAFGDGPRVAALSLVGGIILSLFISAMQFEEATAFLPGAGDARWKKLAPRTLRFVDVYFDLAGFGSYMYGVGIGWHLVGSDNLTPAVILMFAIVGVLCWYAEGMSSLFVTVSRMKKKAGGAAGAGGGATAAAAAQQRMAAQQRAAGGAAGAGGGATPNM